jgi:DNA-binding transcriptional regulator YiaG
MIDELVVRAEEARKRRAPLSQEAAARQVGVSLGTWNAWKQGRMRPTGLSRRALEAWIAAPAPAPRP